MEITANVLDPIEATLPPLVWDKPDAPEPILKPEHVHFVRSKVYRILDQGGYEKAQDWARLYMTGSLCTYQYSDTSDADISLFVDATHLPEWSRAEMIGLLVAKTDGVRLPGTPYDLQTYVVAKHLQPSDLYHEGLRAAYDLDENRWVVPPSRSLSHDPKIQEAGFYVWAMEQADKMERLLRYEPDKAVMFWHQIHKNRQRDMQLGKGDFSESNLIYKFLFKRNLIPAIAQQSGEYIAHASPHGNSGTIGRTYQPQFALSQDSLKPSQEQTAWSWGLDDERQVSLDSDHSRSAHSDHPVLASEYQHAAVSSSLRHSLPSQDSFQSNGDSTLPSFRFVDDTLSDTFYNNFDSRQALNLNERNLHEAYFDDNENTFSSHRLNGRDSVKSSYIPQIAEYSGEHIAAIRTQDIPEYAQDRSRLVSPEEYEQLVEEGRQRYESLRQNPFPSSIDQEWPTLVDRAYQATREPWGGMTIDGHNGQIINPQANIYALSAREPGMNSVSISPGANTEQFNQAMLHARNQYNHILERPKHALGVFHDADKQSIDIDPVMLVDNPRDVESIGAYTNALGGAYHFMTGEGLWPPHVANTWPNFEPYRGNEECYLQAEALAHAHPEFVQDAGFYVHPKRGPGDHAWNVAPDGTIIDTTSAQHPGPEIIPVDHAHYPRYVSWTRNEQGAQQIAHERGEHDGDDLSPVCPLCGN